MVEIYLIYPLVANVCFGPRLCETPTCGMLFRAANVSEASPWAPRPRVELAMVKALARAFRWRRVLDDRRPCDAGGPGSGEGVAPSYVSRIYG